MLQACGNMCLDRECALRRAFLPQVPMVALPAYRVPEWCWEAWYQTRVLYDSGEWSDDRWPEKESWVAMARISCSLSGSGEATSGRADRAPPCPRTDRAHRSSRCATPAPGR